MKKVLTWFGSFMLMMCGLFAFGQMSQAETNNIFVEDGANILSAQDKAKIYDMNQAFQTLDGKPQYVVVTLKDLDGYDDIESYAEKKFQKLGIGQKDLDNGFLFVISIEDRKYRLEVGYGVEDVITDSMKEAVVTAKIEDMLKDERYGEAVMAISQNVNQLVTDRYTDVAASKEEVKRLEAEAAQQKKTIFTGIAGAIATLLGGGGLIYLIRQMKERKMRHRLKKQLPDDYIKKDRVVTIGKKKLLSEDLVKKTMPISEVLADYVRESEMQIEGGKLSQTQIKLLRRQAFMAIFADAVLKQINYKDYSWRVYLNDKYLAPFVNHYADQYGYTFPVPSDRVDRYIQKTNKEYEHSLLIAEQNQQFVKGFCQDYLKAEGVQKRVDLLTALMCYALLKGQDLANEYLVQQLDLSPEAMRKAYRYAKGKQREIDSQHERQAIRDLERMNDTLFTVMMISSWSSYHPGSSSSGGGFGSGGGGGFGGGSSGGGGFSGGW